MNDLLAHEQGPRTAGQTYQATAVQIALDALVGKLPTADVKERFYAADEGIYARARAHVERRATKEVN